MSEADQCIICLEPLPRPSAALQAIAASDAGAGAGAGEPASEPLPTPPAATTTTASDLAQDDSNHLNIAAALDGCNHIIHDLCIRSWAQKTNTCPICRNPFHSVRVYNGVDGTVISKYDVQDKKQVAEFDVRQWLGENPEEEEEEPGNPCPICDSAEREDVLLLCDSCDAAYHTHCIGLEGIPDGDWYCMECSHLFQLTQDPEPTGSEEQSPRPSYVRRPNPRNVRGYHVRTRERLRRARRQARTVEWQGAWGQFSGRFYEMSDLDLDNHDDEDEELEQYRRFQEAGRRELERWQQRMDIARRLGARDVFATTIPSAISERLQAVPEPVQETADERRAWGALDRARETEEPSTNPRKRKGRSVTASPREPVQEPERKLKRPRTRRLPNQNGEGSSSVSSPAPAGPSTARVTTNGLSSRNGIIDHSNIDPPLVSSLLKELEPSLMSEDDTITTNGWRHPPEASSPALSPAISPSPSAHSSPRALSLTPPPMSNLSGRPTSPTLLLSSTIQPRYAPANYSPSRMSHDRSPTRTNHDHSPARINHDHSPTRINRDRSPTLTSHDHSDPETRPVKLQESRPLELRQPRPRRPSEAPTQRKEQSPAETNITQEDKVSINEIVKGALRPHWRSRKLTTEQYSAINRDISRKLYDEVKGAASLNAEARRQWENRATKEVAQAVAELSA
ncbi:ribosomal L37ae [Fusarium heterosporum]|uniref:Ribosomal L37ae n=1 Tax=Fusarium heterosporum TaxID=42747 RepID=A0A8H5WPN3_FUSHE|nr:ribosomal L37ae [Fusarium heterosporum]